MRVRPFKLINAREWNRLRQCCTAVMRDWSGYWLLAADGAQVACGDAFALAGADADPAAGMAQGGTPRPHWRTYALEGEPGLRIDEGSPVRSAFAAAGFGRGARCLEAQRAHDSELLRGVTAAALQDLARRFAEAPADGRAARITVVEADEDTPVPRWRRGDGAIHLRMPLGQAAMRVILEGELVRRLLGAGSAVPTMAEPLTDPRQCLAGRAVVLRAWAGEARISLGELRQLAPGDVIRFESRPDEPFRCTLDGRAIPARTYLGSANGRKALQWISPIDKEESH